MQSAKAQDQWNEFLHLREVPRSVRQGAKKKGACEAIKIKSDSGMDEV